MPVLNSPRTSRPSSRRDTDAIDLAWAVGRSRDWLLGPAPLAADVAAFALSGIGTVLWQLIQRPERLEVPGWLILWGIVVAIHAGVVVAYGAVHSWRSPRRQPVYYADIPPEQRSAARRQTVYRAETVSPTPDPVSPPNPPATTRSTWQGVLAPVTPFPARQGDDGSGMRHPAPPREPDVTVTNHVDRPVTERDPTPGHEEAHGSALDDVRGVLASDRPRLWRRWRRRSAENHSPPPHPIDSRDSWLSPFPGAQPVTRPVPHEPSPTGQPAPASPTATAPSRWRAQPDARWPAQTTHSANEGARGQASGRTDDEDGDHIPSLAAMLRSSNLTTLSDAPISGGRRRPSADNDGPSQTGGVTAPTPLPRRPRPATSEGPSRPTELFTAFGIEESDNTARSAARPGEPRRIRERPADQSPRTPMPR